MSQFSGLCVRDARVCDEVIRDLRTSVEDSEESTSETDTTLQNKTNRLIRQQQQSSLKKHTLAKLHIQGATLNTYSDSKTVAQKN